MDYRSAKLTDALHIPHGRRIPLYPSVSECLILESHPAPATAATEQHRIEDSRMHRERVNAQRRHEWQHLRRLAEDSGLMLLMLSGKR